MSMRILQVARYGSVKGGTESYVRALCGGLREAGHEVALAYRFDPDETRPEVRTGVQLAAISSRSDAPTAVEAAEVGRMVERLRPDLIHTHNVDPSWLAPLLAETAPVVQAIHDHRLTCPTGTRYWAAWKRACTVSPGAHCLAYNLAAHCGSLRANATLEPYRRWRAAHRAAGAAPRLQVFSDYMRDTLTGAGIDAARILVTPYPVPPLAAPVWVGDSDPRPVVFATGRLTREKGFETLLRAISWVRTGVHVVIAGDGHHRAALERAAGTVPSRHRVTLPGWLSGEELAGWYSRAGVVAVPSAWPEPFGIVGLEAMAMARPVVAFAVGGVGQWLADGVTGVAVRPGDERAFGRALDRVLGDEALRERMGTSGRRRAVAEFSLPGHVSTMLEAYDDVRRRWEVAA